MLELSCTKRTWWIDLVDPILTSTKDFTESNIFLLREITEVDRPEDVSEKLDW